MGQEPLDPWRRRGLLPSRFAFGRFFTGVGWWRQWRCSGLSSPRFAFGQFLADGGRWLQRHCSGSLCATAGPPLRRLLKGGRRPRWRCDGLLPSRFALWPFLADGGQCRRQRRSGLLAAADLALGRSCAGRRWWLRWPSSSLLVADLALGSFWAGRWWWLRWLRSDVLTARSAFRRFWIGRGWRR